MTPEARARRAIDAQLEDAGWRVRDAADIDLDAGRGVAVREFPLKPGFGKADYLLYVDGAAAGVVEAKPFGALAGVEAQAARYAAGLPGGLPAHRRPLPFAFASNGDATWFADGRDPNPRARRLFAFPRPETLADRLAEPRSLRARLAALPPLDASRLWAVQARAARNLEESFAHARPRALVQMATGSGKTFVAIAAAWRLLRHAEAGRILFLVDRNTLGRQAENEFANFAPPGESRKFGELYAIQRLAANRINPAAKVVIATVQRLFSMLRGEAALDPDRENESAFGNAAGLDDDDSDPWLGPAPEAAYNPALPPEFFDFIIVDECHRSIYDRWSRALLYFDSFLVGLTATPDNRTIGFFDQNLVMQYGHEEAVADGVNVGFDVWRVRTEIGEAGGTIPAADRPYVAMRDKATRAERLVGLAEDFSYDANRLDRDVVAESQIRTVLREFRHRVLKEAFPGRAEAPKTLVFAKDDFPRRRHRPHRPRGVRRRRRVLRQDHLPHRLRGRPADRRGRDRNHGMGPDERPAAGGGARQLPQRLPPPHRRDGGHDLDRDRRETHRMPGLHARGPVGGVLRTDEGARSPRDRPRPAARRDPERAGQGPLRHRRRRRRVRARPDRLPPPSTASRREASHKY